MAGEIGGLAPYVRTVADGQEVFPGVHVRIAIHLADAVFGRVVRGADGKAVWKPVDA